jgi:hypothetical protein
MARDSFLAARGALFPNGLLTINFSYGQQAGEAKLRAARMTPDAERTLRRSKTADGATLLEQYERLQATALRIGAKEKERAQMGAMNATGPKTIAARHQWIRAIQALASVLALAGADDAEVLGRIRAAEAKADANAPAVKEPEVPPTPSEEPVVPS